MEEGQGWGESRGMGRRGRGAERAGAGHRSGRGPRTESPAQVLVRAPSECMDFTKSKYLLYSR